MEYALNPATQGLCVQYSPLEQCITGARNRISQAREHLYNAFPSLEQAVNKAVTLGTDVGQYLQERFFSSDADLSTLYMGNRQNNKAKREQEGRRKGPKMNRKQRREQQLDQKRSQRQSRMQHPSGGSKYAIKQSQPTRGGDSPSANDAPPAYDRFKKAREEVQSLRRATSGNPGYHQEVDSPDRTRDITPSDESRNHYDGRYYTKDALLKMRERAMKAREHRRTSHIGQDRDMSYEEYRRKVHEDAKKTQEEQDESIDDFIAKLYGRS